MVVNLVNEILPTNCCFVNPVNFKTKNASLNIYILSPKIKSYHIQSISQVSSAMIYLDIPCILKSSFSLVKGSNSQSSQVSMDSKQCLRGKAQFLLVLSTIL